MVIRHARHLKNKIFTQVFMRFFVGGLANYLFNVIFTFIGVELLGFDYLIFYITAYTISTIFNFIVAVKYVFRVNGDYHNRFVKFFIITTIFYFSNILTVNLLVSKLMINYIVAITIATGLFFLLKFLIYDYFIFHTNGPKIT